MDQSYEYPAPLNRGDAIAIFAPSLPLAYRFPDRFLFGVKALEEHLGVKAKVARNVMLETNDIVALSGSERAAIFNDLVANDEIKAIFCSIGGFNSSDMLPYIDFEAARHKPKFLVGYSDSTSLLVAMASRSNWVTFHGPMIMPQFGEYPRPQQYTVTSLCRLLFEERRRVEFQAPVEWTAERLEWGNDEWRIRARTMQKGAAPQIWRSSASIAEGILWGGNIETLNFLIGTKYVQWPDKIVLFWEATAEEAFLPRVRRALTHLDQAGILDRTTAMLIGRSPDVSSMWGATLRDTVLDITSSHAFPIISDLPFGHTDPQDTIPLGCSARISTDRGFAMSIELPEKALI